MCPLVIIHAGCSPAYCQWHCMVNTTCCCSAAIQYWRCCVGSAVLKCLKKRMTVVPLNKTRASVARPEKQQQAHAKTNGRATLALELVGYEQQVEVAMKYAFGMAFVCDDKNAAQKVSEEVRIRGVSLQGDDFNPNGTITGGSRSQNTPVLQALIAVNATDQELQQHEVSTAAQQQCMYTVQLILRAHLLQDGHVWLRNMSNTQPQCQVHC